MQNYFVSYMYLGKTSFGLINGFGSGTITFKDFIASAEDIKELMDKVYEMAKQAHANQGEQYVEIMNISIINYKKLAPPLLSPQKIGGIKEA